jgi:hypothetical protein
MYVLLFFPLFLCAKVVLPPTEKVYFHFEGSVLYWQSKMWGLEFGEKSFLPTDAGPDIEQFQQKVFIPDFAFLPGFKLELGGGLPRDGWDIEARWTYMQGKLTHLKKHLTMQINPAGKGIVPLWYEPLGAPRSSSIPLHFTRADGFWNMVFNSGDLELGRTFLSFSAMPMRLLLGMKGASVHQTYQAKYADGSDFYQVGVFYLLSKMDAHSTLFGAGPRGGFASKWAMGWGWSLIADGVFSLLYSAAEIETKFLHQFSDPASDRSSRMKEHAWAFVPVVEVRLGVDWGGWMGKAMYLGVSFAYEMQYWWDQNRFRRAVPFNAPGNLWDMRGDLQMRGLTASLCAEF